MLAAAIFLVDLTAPMGISISVIYIALVLISFLSPYRSITIVMAFVATVLTLVAFFMSSSETFHWLGFANCVLSLLAIWAVTLFSMRRSMAQEAVRKSEQRYALAFRGANDGLWIWNLLKNKMYFSPRWKEIIGWDDSLVGESPDEWFKRVHPEDIKRLRAGIDDHVDRKTNHFEHEHRILHKDGSYRWVLNRGLADWNEKGNPIRIAGSLTDITRRKHAEEGFRRLAIRDGLTGVFSRRYFMERLEMEVKSAKRYGYSLSVCLCDLDSFKRINDNHGHRIGDRVLRRFGRLLTNRLRTENIVGRYGGDEFCMIFPHTPAGMASNSLERIRCHWERLMFQVDNSRFFSMTATFGIADLRQDLTDEKSLLESADKALYFAKNQGRNRIVISDQKGKTFKFQPDSDPDNVGVRQG